MIKGQYAKVQEDPSLIKDLSNGGVINTDDRKYQEHKRVMELAKRNRLEKDAQSDSINRLEKELNSMKNDFDSMKSMLKTLIDRTN